MDQAIYYTSDDEENKDTDQMNKKTKIEDNQTIVIDNPVFDIDYQQKLEDQNSIHTFTKPGLKRCVNGEHKEDMTNKKYIYAKIDDYISNR